MSLHSWELYTFCLLQHIAAKRNNDLESFVLLLDDIWEKVNLKAVGVPHPSRQNRCKVAFTTRSRDCRWSRLGRGRAFHGFFLASLAPFLRASLETHISLHLRLTQSWLRNSLCRLNTSTECFSLELWYLSTNRNALPSLTLDVLVQTIFNDIDPEFFKECLTKFRYNESKESEVDAKRQATWKRLEEIGMQKQKSAS
uniref:NB-ARC domain-containing protein n=2 Tax=Brassica oleracea TaxID=3712 RepID=A0A0D3DPI6_BRAOL|nr:unnamed protein product [Brassica oleracea]